MTVLVLTEEFDPTADRVVALLAERDVPVFRFDTADFPQQLSLAAAVSDDAGWSGSLRTDYRKVSLRDVRSVWYRRPSAFILPDGLSGPERDLAYAEARFGVGGVLATLQTLWVNDPRREADVAYKPAQLVVAAKCGLHVPRTLVTNDPQAVREFRSACRGPLIVKLLGAAAFVEQAAPKIVHTTLLTEDDLCDLGGVATTAHLFQEWVSKRCEARVTVVGASYLAAGISADSAAAHVDWRSDYNALEYSIVEVPDPVRQGIAAFMQVFGLVFGAFDFVVRPDGEWVFLECNPAGQFGWIEEVTGLPISQTLADLLSAGVVP